ncbi:hypothetical protein KTH_42490 [Thermosporothrix hazakensis]|uniref:Uncharacterized protein n=1 Tax=Thermosporothrix sp. COM3 TaxID=2490863 RepID=A0A455T1I3_9CHLR|nr:hypothetical protein KTC_59850 [Thermosporothrix sp. COM3]GCE49380.1 hypothetical protein KTH_42490 [Thermosporothrix hazakensis]
MRIYVRKQSGSFKVQEEKSGKDCSFVLRSISGTFEKDFSQAEQTHEGPHCKQKRCAMAGEPELDA